MNKVYYLSSCDTCRRILKESAAADYFELRDIKTNPISPEELDQLASAAESYGALFSRRAVKYRAMSLQNKILTEMDYRSLILSEYTFLKRPVFWWKGKVFVGSDTTNLQALRSAMR